MEGIAKFIENALSFGPRQGWVLLIAGGVTAALDHFSLLPGTGFPDGWRLAPYVIAILGGAILVVHYVAAASASADEKSLSRKRQKALLDRYERIQVEAPANIDHLSSEEQELLVFLLRRGRQRFHSTLFMVPGSDGLRSKWIIHPDPNAVASDMWLVTESVWREREALMDRFHDLLPRGSVVDWPSRIT